MFLMFSIKYKSSSFKCIRCAFVKIRSYLSSFFFNPFSIQAIVSFLVAVISGLFFLIQRIASLQISFPERIAFGNTSFIAIKLVP